MFPFVQLGPLALPVAPLVLLLGAWLGGSLTEREAARLGLDARAIAALWFTSLLAGLLAARLGYVAQHLDSYRANPWGVLARDTTTLSPLAGLLIGSLAALGIGRWRRLALWPTLDALTPGLLVLLLALGIAHLASGQAYGAPSTLPWSIELWGARRHPSQVYEIIGALGLLLLWWRIRRWQPFAGFTCVSVAALAAGLWLFLEAFRGDSLTTLGGLRVAQLWALVVLAGCLAALHWLSRRAPNPPS